MSKFMIGFLLIILSFPLIGCSSSHSELRNAELQRCYDLGQESQKAGLRPNANPYTGLNSHLSEKWLKGWIDSKLEQEK